MLPTDTRCDRVTFATTLLLVVAVAGCSDASDQPTGPGSDGDAGTASAVVHDDPGGAGDAFRASLASTDARATDSASYSGSLRADVKVQVSTDGSAWTDVNEQATSRSEVALQSSSATTVASEASVEADTYSHVRIVMDNSSATLEGGSSFGASTGGLTLEADAELTLGSSGRVVIEKEVGDFQVSADSNTTIAVDLNSGAWIDRESVEARAVSGAEIESAATVTVD